MISSPISEPSCPLPIINPITGPPNTNPLSPLPTITNPSPPTSPNLIKSPQPTPSPNTEQSPSSSFPTVSVHPMVTRTRDATIKLKTYTDGTIPWPPHCSTAITIPDEPSNFTEASKHPEWQSAMNQEFQALLQTKTWDLVPPSSSSNTLGVKWVFRTK